MLPILLAAVCAALALAPDGVASGLAFDRQAILAGEIWRLWTGHLVHFSPLHALVDTAVLFLVSGIAVRETGTRSTCLALAAGAPLISLGLLLVAPELML